MMQVISPKAPKSAGWKRAKDVEKAIQAADPLLRAYPPQVWHHDSGVCVVSSVDKVDALPGEPDLGPEYHISISSNGRRATLSECMWALAQFDCDDAKEDNHVNGIARDWWRPVADHLSGYECPCQETETAIVEDKGNFIWRPVPGQGKQ